MRRTSLQIIAEILKGLKEPNGITNLMYNTGGMLSYLQAEKYLNLLIECGFVWKNNRKYLLTDPDGIELQKLLERFI